MELESCVNAIGSTDLVLVNDIPGTHGRCSRWAEGCVLQAKGEGALEK